MNNDDSNLGLPISKIFDDRYVVPLYQRNFAWRKEEIEQLLQDVYEAYRQGKNNYYIGSLVVLKRHNGDYEVIDGQQRLTTLSLITKILGGNQSQVLFYDSRPEVEDFFRVFYAGNSDLDSLQSPAIFYLKEAIESINNVNLLSGNNNSNKIIGINEVPHINGKNFASFFFNNVILVRVEIPEDTDVAAYFEIMNNRGEQLQKHEILKALMLEKIKNGENYNLVKQKQFAFLWDACSHINVPIQSMFEVKDRVKYFGEEYNGFIPFVQDNLETSGVISLDFPTPDVTFVQDKSKASGNANEGYSINDILDESKSINGTDEEQTIEEADDDATKFTSIIDFPNFLMHVLKLYDRYINDNKSENIPLNEKDLLTVYSNISVDSMKFIELLLWCRTVFDRFVVKTIVNEKNEEGTSWSLKKPDLYKNPNNDKESHLQYIGTFDSNEQRSENAMVIKALSMLQVTFRTRIHKNWLQYVLAWFYGRENRNDLNAVTSKEYIDSLNSFLLSFYDGKFGQIVLNNKVDKLTKDTPFSDGVKTHHFIFNFIDYLYWCDKGNAQKNGIKDFEFKNWNSVEHHLAKNQAQLADSLNYSEYVNNLGNLCLISRNANSRLSDRIVKEKVRNYSQGNLGANRQIMYNMTRDNNDNWGKDQITEHYRDLVGLLARRYKILGIPEQSS